MLISHLKKFIFFKTNKTGSTSVEIAFQPYCVPAGTLIEEHTRELVSEYGVVGSRMEGRRRGDVFTGHMSAEELLEQIDVPILKTYFKFVVIRNPYDRIVSSYNYDFSRLVEFDESHRDLFEKIQSGSIEELRKHFREYVERNIELLFKDRDIYILHRNFDPLPLVNFYIRYENILEDVGKVCDRLDIDKNEIILGRFKSGYRFRQDHFSTYYDDTLKALIEKEYAFEIGKFGYRCG